jgi:guanylate kinase
VIIVIAGPGGVGKGTVVKRLVAREPSLWLSRSWTTRARRPGEPADAYTFVDRATFEKRIDAGGFLEHAEFLGHLYGSPYPEPEAVPPGSDIVLEIDVQGAEQVGAREPDVLFLFLTAPSLEEQEARLRGRGDPADKVTERLAVTRDEMAAAEKLGARFVVNDDLESTVDELLAIIEAHRAAR